MFPGLELLVAGHHACEGSVQHEMRTLALLAAGLEHSVLDRLKRSRVRGRNSRLDDKFLLAGLIPRPRDPQGVLARFEVPREGRLAHGTDVLAIDEYVGAGYVGDDLDPSEEMLFG